MFLGQSRYVKMKVLYVGQYIVKNPIITVLKKIKSNVSNSTQAKQYALIIKKPSLQIFGYCFYFENFDVLHNLWSFGNQTAL